MPEVKAKYPAIAHSERLAIIGRMRKQSTQEDSSSDSHPSGSPTPVNLRHDTVTQVINNARVTEPRQSEAEIVCPEDDPDVFFVEKLLKHRASKRGRRQYLVRWLNCGPEGDSWEYDRNSKGEQCIERSVIETYWNGQPIEDKEVKRAKINV